MNSESSIPEQAARTAFDSQAREFDTLYGNDQVIRYKRERVRSHVQKFLATGSSILELNAGTGEDAVYFASQGHRVHATDISPEMQAVLREKAGRLELKENISSGICSFTELEQLENQGPYDLIFSNFAGLNCTDRLDKVLDSFDFLLRPGGHVTLVVLPGFCLWEFMMLFRGKFKTAFRRFTGNKGTEAKINNETFRCWYYNPSYIRRGLGKNFRLIALEGLCTIVPPSYLEGFAEKRPRLFRKLKEWENSLKGSWPWKSVGDYFIITFQKK
jgi:ubiquinone/menaquinone biosynthesis C-methylase UbiE